MEKNKLRIEDKIASTKHINYNLDRLLLINEILIDETLLVKEILQGILLIETYFRKRLFRLLEYLLVIFSIILNILFRVPIKNYTVGPFQIGLSYLLYYNGVDIKTHLKYIKRIKLNEAYIIIKSFQFKENLKINCLRIKDYEKQYQGEKLLVRKIGKEYNGEYGYGVLLEKVLENKNFKEVI